MLPCTDETHLSFNQYIYIYNEDVPLVYSHARWELPQVTQVLAVVLV